jgi:hypothetical protein
MPRRWSLSSFSYLKDPDIGLDSSFLWTIYAI